MTRNEACSGQEKKIEDEHGQVHEHKDEKHLGGEQLPPVAGTSDPELTIANERLALDGANDGEQPCERNEDDEDASPGFEVQEAETAGDGAISPGAGMQPAIGQTVAVGNRQGE